MCIRDSSCTVLVFWLTVSVVAFGWFILVVSFFYLIVIVDNIVFRAFPTPSVLKNSVTLVCYEVLVCTLCFAFECVGIDFPNCSLYCFRMVSTFSLS